MEEDEEIKTNEYGEVIFDDKCRNAINFNMWLNAIEERTKNEEEK